MSISPAQRQALRDASRKGGVHVGTPTDKDGVPQPDDKHVKTQVANRLLTAGLATQHDRTLLITKEGRAALAAPTIDPPVYLHARDGLTTERHRAIRDEPEVIDPATLKSYWAEESARRKIHAEDRKTEARRLRDQVMAA